MADDKNSLSEYLDSVGLPTLAYGAAKVGTKGIKALIKGAEAIRSLPLSPSYLARLGARTALGPAGAGASMAMDPTPANQGEVPYYVYDQASGKYVPNPKRTDGTVQPQAPQPSFNDKFAAAQQPQQGRPTWLQGQTMGMPGQQAVPSSLMGSAQQWLNGPRQQPQQQPMAQAPQQPLQQQPAPQASVSLPYSQASDTAPQTDSQGLLQKLRAVLAKNADAAINLQS